MAKPKYDWLDWRYAALEVYERWGMKWNEERMLARWKAGWSILRAFGDDRGALTSR